MSARNSTSWEQILPAEQETYADYFSPRLLWVAPLLFVTGIFGNILSIVVFLQPSMRKNSTFTYLLWLCVVDIFVIAFGLGDLILIAYFGKILRNTSFVACRLHTFLTFSFTHLSSFILASVSIDRAVATNAINFAKVYCKPAVAYKVIGVSILLTFIINFHNLFFLGFEHVQVSEKNQSDGTLKNVSEKFVICGVKENTAYNSFVDPYYQWMDLTFYAILPFFIMACCSFLIIRVLFKSNQRLNKNKANNRAPTAEKNKEEHASSEHLKVGQNEPRGSRLSVASILQAIRPRAGTLNRQTNSRMNKTLHLTYTLITINILFFVLVSPLIITLISIRGKEKVQKYQLLFNIVYLLAYANHSFNFIFYGLSSPPYRNVILGFFKPKRQNQI
nr:G protein-coupled receptor [Proales similis]